MKNKLKIFFVSPEVSPFVKTSSLAEASAELPKVLKEHGHDVRIMMPNYRCVNERKYTLRDVIRLKDMALEVGKQITKADGKSAFLPDSKVQIYLLTSKQYFDRDGLYQDSAGRDYKDNAGRFMFFCRGCLETLKLLQWQPDIIHCHDWQTALIPVYLKTIYKDDPFFKNTSVLLTLHNVGSQGIFDSAALEKAGLISEITKTGNYLEFNGRINFLNGGLLTADTISTVSQTYASEIQHSAEYGMGLESVLRSRRNDLFGIVSGVNYADWNPETDPHLPFQYSVNNIDTKVLNKQALLNKAGLEFNDEIPVIGMLSRLESQKGFDLLEENLDDLMAFGGQMLVVGSGEEKYHKFLTRAAKKYARQFFANFRTDNALVHLLVAGADMLLVPSRHEPCGSHQIYAMRYGTIPIVHATGGLADTVANYEQRTENGTGFVFKKYEAEDMLKALERAVKLFRDKKRWAKLAKNAMKQNFSWEVSAEKYLKLYTRAVTKAKK